MEQTWTITDADGSNPRTVTLAEFRAEVEANKARARAIFAADCRASGLDASRVLGLIGEPS